MPPLPPLPPPPITCTCRIATTSLAAVMLAVAEWIEEENECYTCNYPGIIIVFPIVIGNYRICSANSSMSCTAFGQPPISYQSDGQSLPCDEDLF